MIFNTKEEKDAVQVGDIKNNNVSIDTNNIDFIVTILSTNLYSKPIESFIRETVSNAWDSHREAGSDEPVLLELGKDMEGAMFCRIQDFGVGLSPERFMNIYKNIGSSTKRGSNTQIGGFGIGRFSALAYNDVVHITSVYEGMKYQYMMYKDGNSISIDLLHDQPTDERNGVEVKLAIKYGDFDNFASAIKSQLVYFENLYIIDTTGDKDNSYRHSIDIENQYNNFSIKKYDNFWVNTLDTSKEINLVLGKVRYPLRIGSLDKYYPGKVESYPISLIFDIGDLQVTPNREELLYSDQNKDIIQARLDLAIAEIDDLIEQEKTKDYDKLSDYMAAVQETQYLVLLENPQGKVRLKLTDTKKKLTLQGEFYNPKNFVAMHDFIMSYTGFTAQYALSNNQVQYVNRGLSLTSIKNYFDRVYFGDLGEVKNISKRYIRETFTNNSYFIKTNRSLRSYAKEYIQAIHNNIESYHTSKDLEKFDMKAFKVIFNNVISNLSKIPRFTDRTVPQQWILDTKAADKAKRGNIKQAGFDWKQNINFHEIRYANSGSGVTTDSTAYVMKDLPKTFKSITVYDEKDSSKLRTLFEYLKPNVKIKMVEVAPTKLKLLKNVDNFVKFNEFMSTEHKLIRNIGTVEYLKRELPFLSELAKINNVSAISTRLAQTIDTLASFVETYESSSHRTTLSVPEQELVDNIYNICEEKDYFNEEIRGLFKQFETELKNARVLIPLTDSGQYSNTTTFPLDRINTIVDYVLTRKLIRPSVAALIKLKKETIFNIIPEEDENN